MHSVFLIISIVIAIVMFIFVMSFMFSSKFRSKVMGHQLKMQKQMLDDNKKLLQELGMLSGEIGVKTTKGIIDENEDDLRNIATKGADISKDAISKTAKAIKQGLTEDTIYCKHCGESIDADSIFCKKCGKEQ